MNNTQFILVVYLLMEKSIRLSLYVVNFIIIFWTRPWMIKITAMFVILEILGTEIMHFSFWIE